MDRREFLKGLVLTGIGALIGSSVIEDLVLDKLLRSNEPTNTTEMVIITVTQTASNSQAPQTYTTTVTQTVTETETTTEYSNTTVTQTPTQTSSTTTQPPQNLEQILFGNSNMQFIPLEVTNVEIGSNNAHITVYDHLTKTQLKIELPIKYVSNGNINIGNLLSAANNYNQNNGTNYKVYFVLGRANINQAIQQNGQWILPASEIYYNILISDRGWKDVYNALQNLGNGNATVVMPTSNQGPYSNSLYGWDNVSDDSIIIVYQNGQQVNSVGNYINLADSILGTPNNPNPSSQGILHVDTIASTQQVGVYNNQYPVDEVNKYFGTYIVLIQEQGNELFSNL
jgi:hypothetical protein